MRVIGQRMINDFASKHTTLKPHLLAWFYEVSASKWAGIDDLRERYHNLTISSKSEVVFMVDGQSCLISTSINYMVGVLYIHDISLAGH